MVNVSYAVFDKTGHFCQHGSANCGLTPYFFQLSNLFKAAANFDQTNPCANRDDGDGIVQFDRMAHRWILSQFAVPSGGPYYHCVAVSKTADATGSYFVYAFPQAYFPDYPKISVWPDGYYATFNMFNGGHFVGAQVCVYERSAMLSGAIARQMCSHPNSSYGSLLASDLDGKSDDLTPTPPPIDASCPLQACPPAGTPNILANFYGGMLQLGWVSVNWSTAGGTMLWPQALSGAASFTPACNGGACIPQPGTKQQLDSLGDRLMFRLAYSRPCQVYSSPPPDPQCKTWDPYYHLVVSHAVTVKPSVSSVTGVRWYDLRPSFNLVATPPTLTTTINQQSTFSPPDSDYRWMSSIAMDRAGNIGVGYSRSNGNSGITSLYPSIAVAMRSASDPNSSLTSESIVFKGFGSQTKYNRWGDYTHMSVDPVDGCTLWFVGQYQTVNGVFDWSTLIYRTKATSCQ
jgi:hypothetical protein